MKRAAGVVVLMLRDQRYIIGEGRRGVMAVRARMHMMPAAPEDAVEQHREQCNQAGDFSVHGPATI